MARAGRKDFKTRVFHDSGYRRRDRSRRAAGADSATEADDPGPMAFGATERSAPVASAWPGRPMPALPRGVPAPAARAASFGDTDPTAVDAPPAPADGVQRVLIEAMRAATRAADAATAAAERAEAAERRAGALVARVRELEAANEALTRRLGVPGPATAVAAGAPSRPGLDLSAGRPRAPVPRPSRFEVTDDEVSLRRERQDHRFLRWSGAAVAGRRREAAAVAAAAAAEPVAAEPVGSAQDLQAPWLRSAERRARGAAAAGAGLGKEASWAVGPASPRTGSVSTVTAAGAAAPERTLAVGRRDRDGEARWAAVGTAWGRAAGEEGGWIALGAGRGLRGRTARAGDAAASAVVEDLWTGLGAPTGDGAGGEAGWPSLHPGFTRTARQRTARSLWAQRGPAGGGSAAGASALPARQAQPPEARRQPRRRRGPRPLTAAERLAALDRVMAHVQGSA